MKSSLIPLLILFLPSYLSTTVSGTFGRGKSDVSLGVTVPIQVSVSQEAYDNIKVTRVIDGETLELENGEKIRLIGIDCPEIDIGEGKEACEFTKWVAEEKRLRLKFDVQRYDKYGRFLAYVYVKWPSKDLREVRWEPDVDKVTCFGAKDGVEFFLNAYLVKHGFAQPMKVPPNIKYADLFQRLYKEARKYKRGLRRE